MKRICSYSQEFSTLNDTVHVGLLMLLCLKVSSRRILKIAIYLNKGKDHFIFPAGTEVAI